MKKMSAFAPATIANFIVGFDCLGACLESLDGKLFGDIVTFSPSTSMQIEITGQYGDHLPPDNQDNLVAKCVEIFHGSLVKQGLPKQTFTLQLEKRLPVSSGLGSSASSIVATLVGLNAYYEYPFSNEELLLMAGDMERLACGEAHYDNVAPSLLGGLQLMMPQGLSQRLPHFEDWLFVLYYPGIEVSTKMAREILPDLFRLKDVVAYWQQFSAFIHALHTQNRKLVISLLSDKLLEPHRAKLIPHYATAKETALCHGALAFGISGSGPTCFAIADSLVGAQKISEKLTEVIQDNKRAFTKICKISSRGAHVIEAEK